MKILIGVDGSASSLDAVRMVGRLVDPSRDEVAIYFSPMELEKRLLGRSRRIIDGAAAALFEEACSLLPGGFAKPVEMIASSRSAAVGLLEPANPPFARSGERAAHVSEQCVGEDRIVQPRHVH